MANVGFQLVIAVASLICGLVMGLIASSFLARLIVGLTFLYFSIQLGNFLYGIMFFLGILLSSTIVDRIRAARVRKEQKEIIRL